MEEGASRKGDAPSGSLPVYGAAYRLAVEATEMASRLERNYRYSLGEDVRRGVKDALLRIALAGKNGRRVGSLSDWDGLPDSKSLFHSPPGCGLPIGNLTSQLFSIYGPFRQVYGVAGGRGPVRPLCG